MARRSATKLGLRQRLSIRKQQNKHNKVLGNQSVATGEACKKRCRMMVDTSKGFKKEFDPAPSKLSNRPPLGKNTPYKSMMAGWWLEEHPDFEMLDKGEAWLKGFRGRLEASELHKLDWDHLKELEKWHEEQEDTSESSDVEHAEQVVEGSSTQVV